MEFSRNKSVFFFSFFYYSVKDSFVSTYFLLILYDYSATLYSIIKKYLCKNHFMYTICNVKRPFFNSCITWQTPTTTTTTTTKQTNFDPIPKFFCHSNFGKAFGLRPLIKNQKKTKVHRLLWLTMIDNMHNIALRQQRLLSTCDMMIFWYFIAHHRHNIQDVPSQLHLPLSYLSLSSLP